MLHKIRKLPDSVQGLVAAGVLGVSALAVLLILSLVL
jgi:hypothetical protein